MMINAIAIVGYAVYYGVFPLLLGLLLESVVPKIGFEVNFIGSYFISLVFFISMALISEWMRNNRVRTSTEG